MLPTGNLGIQQLFGFNAQSRGEAAGGAILDAPQASLKFGDGGLRRARPGSKFHLGEVEPSPQGAKLLTVDRLPVPHTAIISSKFAVSI